MLSGCFRDEDWEEVHIIDDINLTYFSGYSGYPSINSDGMGDLVSPAVVAYGVDGDYIIALRIALDSINNITSDSEFYAIKVIRRQPAHDVLGPYTKKGIDSPRSILNIDPDLELKQAKRKE